MATQLRDPAPLARAAIIWTWIWLAAQTLFGFASLYQLLVLTGLPPETPLEFGQSLPELALSDGATGVAALGLIVAFLGSGFLILKWVYRTNANAHAFASDMNVSPGWNVGWFFIPFANLIKPFQGVRETWQVSHGDGGHWSDRPVPVFLRWWWACWLAMSLLDNLSFRLSLRGDSLGDLMVVSAIDVVSSAIGVPLGLLVIALVRRLTAAQTAMLHGETFA